jgi:hypothetical protein
LSNEYTTLALLKAHLGGITDTDRDTLLNAVIEAASRSIDDYCGRRFYLDASATARTFHPAGRLYYDELLVDDIGDTTGLTVETGNAADGWTAVTTSVETSPDNALVLGDPVTGLINLNGWSLCSRDRVRVTAKWGFPAVPAQVAHAALIQSARLYKRRESPEGVLGNAEWGSIRLSRTDPDVAALVQRFVIPGAR